MSRLYADCAEIVRRLHESLRALEGRHGMLQLAPLAGREWYDLLTQKLLPQLHDDAFLVVAVVGGTNIGKSVIFNHLAGDKASATSPLASGTKHPVCLVPPGFSDKHDLAAIFQGFQLQEWSNPQAPLEERPEHWLFWRTSERTPENLLVLDTPDMDSDALVNWHRADIIRRSADVLIAVLTQQKYNDAAVKQFFRKAAAEDKAVIVVFNQCQLPEDDDYWPLWLKTFCDETRVVPEFVYVAPNDRRAAEENRLPFYERQWPAPSPMKPVSPGEVSQRESAGAAVDTSSRSLTDDLSRLRFQDIKLRTLRGSLKQLVSAEDGAPIYLREVRRRSEEFRSAADRLSSEGVVKVTDWPALSNQMFVAEIRRWWRMQQEGWARRITTFYDTLGQGVTWPVRFAKEKLGKERIPPLELYRKQEWLAVLKAVDEVYEKLTWMSESGNELLRPRFERLLAGTSRQQLLNRLKDEHQQVALDVELAQVVDGQMQEFQAGSPELYRFYKQLNHIAAAVRPMASVVLFTMGWGPAGEVVAPIVADAVAHAVVPIVADFAGGTTAAVAGETALSSATGKGAGFLQAKFQRLQATFVARRALWLAQLLKRELLGEFPEELQAAATVAQSDEFRAVSDVLDRLSVQFEQRLSGTADAPA